MVVRGISGTVIVVIIKYGSAVMLCKIISMVTPAVHLLNTLDSFIGYRQRVPGTAIEAAAS